MKISLLDLGHHGDALIILQSPNAQRYQSSKSKKDQDAPNPEQSVASTTTSEAVRNEDGMIELNPESTAHDDKSATPTESLARLKMMNPYTEGGEPTEVQFRGSSRHLCLASPVFQAMIEGQYKESVPNAQGLLEIKASDWDVEVFLILLNIIHGHHRNVPKKVGIETLAQVAVLVDYYNCHEIVDIFAQRWIDQMPGSATTIQIKRQHQMHLIFSTWVFCHPIFESSTKLALEEGEGIFATDLPMPDAIMKRLNDRREEIIDGVLTALYDFQETLVTKKSCCSSACSSMLLAFGLV